jgi:hypothetical protein
LEENIFIRALIDRQRQLVASNNPTKRFGTLWVAAMLDQRLLRCSDRQIAMLLPLVQERLGLFEPETGICEHARRRLLRSVGTGPRQV